MDVYLYKAALLCSSCGGKMQRALLKHSAPADPSNEVTYNSDNYPKGPYSGGGEADCPQHCDMCGAFLENALTKEGRTYVQDAVNDPEPWHAADLLETWSAFYGVRKYTKQEE